MMFSFGRNFWLLSISMFLFMTSFNLIIPVLNGFITHLDGENYKGLIFLFFSLSAAISRPFSGKLSDNLGRKPVMFIGVALAACSSLLYPLSTTVSLFLGLRLIHGFSAGFLPTGATALATDILPADKRGQGMGIWGVFISLGFGVGQSFGSLIEQAFGIDALFFFGTIVCLVAGILLLYVKETLPIERRVKFHFGLLKVNWKDVFEPSVLPVGIVMFLSATCSGAVFVLVPDLAGYVGIENTGAYFTYYAFSTILVRLFSSSMSDIIGRRKSLIIGVSLLIASMLLTAFTRNELTFGIAATLFGIATGINSPTLMAWMGDLSPVHRRGAGSGTLFIALELGIMLGAGITLLTYKNDLESMFFTFICAMCFAIVGLIYLIWHLNRRESLT